MSNSSLRGALSGPRAILFDWDNTLVDSWPNIVHTMNVTLRTMGRSEWSAEEAHRRIARSLRDTFPDLFGERWMEARAIFYQELEKSHIDMLTAMSGSRELLDFLSQRKIPMGVVSNKTSGYLHEEVSHLGWERYFLAVYGSGDLPHDKPEPDGVFAFLQRAGLAPGADIWFVGDSPVDMQIAHASGCGAVLFGRENNGFLQENMKPDEVFADCHAFMKRVRHMDAVSAKH